MEALKKWTQPLIIDTFRSLSAIDFYTPLLSILTVIPIFGPQTTLAEIDSLKVAIEKARDYTKENIQKLNKIYHSAPNQKLRDYMKTGIGQYLELSIKMCDTTIEALSGTDMKKMKEATEELKAEFLKADNLKRWQKDLMSQFEISSSSY
jgi:hypothetical protein